MRNNRCARKAGLIEPKRRGRASEAERDTCTRDLFEVAAC